MMKEKIIVKPAIESDCNLIFTWRNDEFTREMSLTTSTISWETHKNWFENTMKSDDRLLLMCSYIDTGEKICVVVFDLDKDRAIVSINLAPNMRGKGLAKKCLNMSILYLKRHAPKVKFLDAEIKKINHASITIFQGVGFSQIVEKELLLRFQYEI